MSTPDPTNRQEARTDAQHRAHRAESQAALLVESVQDYALFTLSPTGTVESWNRGAERIKGYRPDEIIGRHFSTFYPPEDVGAGKCERGLEVAEREGRFEEEGWRVRKDGSMFWAHVVLTAMRDSTGKLVGFAKVTRDLTERRQAEESLRRSEERFRTLVDAVKDYAIFRLDPNGLVESWNSGAQRIKGYTAREAVGMHMSRFYPPEDAKAGKPAMLLKQAREEGRVEDEGWRVRKDGSRFWADVIISAVRDDDGKLIGYSKVTRDLTLKRQAEEERIRLAQAQAAVRERDEFLSIASHELKTPLTSVRLQLDAAKFMAQSVDPKLAERIDKANRGTARLAALIDTLLDVSQIATGRISLSHERFDLAALLRDLGESYAEDAKTARCPLTVSAPESVVGEWDRLRVSQIIGNLLGNAFKYAQGGPVELSLDRQGDLAVIAVSDRGPGLQEADRSRVFGRFERASSLRHYGGLGLGLYVTNEIAMAHGGTACAERREGGGARFIITLPIRPPAEKTDAG